MRSKKTIKVQIAFHNYSRLCLCQKHSENDLQTTFSSQFKQLYLQIVPYRFLILNDKKERLCEIFPDPSKIKFEVDDKK